MSEDRSATGGRTPSFSKPMTKFSASIPAGLERFFERIGGVHGKSAGVRRVVRIAVREDARLRKIMEEIASDYDVGDALDTDFFI